MSAALPAFDYQRLDAFKVAREALRLGDALARDFRVAMPPYRTNTAARFSARTLASRKPPAAKVPTGCAASAVRAARHASRGRAGGRAGSQPRPEAEILTLLALLDACAPCLPLLIQKVVSLAGNRRHSGDGIPAGIVRENDGWPRTSTGLGKSCERRRNERRLPLTPWG